MDEGHSREKQTPYIYDLQSVIVHAGRGGKSGHYFSFVKSQDGDWYKCNDTRITKVDVELVLKQQAYLLFYKLRPADKIKTPGYENSGQELASPPVRLRPEEEEKVPKEVDLDHESSFESVSISSHGDGQS